MKAHRLTEEADNQKGNGKGFMGTKSYQDYVKNKVTLGEKEIVSLTAERQKIADQHMPSMEQKRMFNDLKKLLLCKLNANQEAENLHKGHRLGNNVNVLQL